MSVKLTLTGSGTIGEIQSGWSVQEDATPVAPGDSSGSVGQVQLDAAPGVDSEFIVDNKSSFNHDRLGTISGDISSVDAKGATVSTNSTLNITSTTPLNKLAVQRTAVGISVGTIQERLYDQVFQASGFYSPIDDTISYAVNSVGGAVTVTDRKTGTSTGFFGVNAGEAPLLVTRDAAGNSYVAYGSNIIRKYGPGPTYSLVTSWGSTGTGNGQFTDIHAIDTDGTYIYTLDNYTNGRVQKFSLSGTYVTKWGSTGLGNGQFTYASGLAVSSEGDIYVSDGPDVGALTTLGNRVQAFNNTGTFLSSWYTGIPYQTNAPISFDSTGNLWMAGYSRVAAYTKTGGLATILPYSVIPGSGVPTPWRYIISNVNSPRVFGVRDDASSVGFGPYNIVSIFSNAMYLSDILHYYIQLLIDPTIQISYTATNNPLITLPGWTGDVWDHLKQICSAYAIEIAVVNDVVTIRNVGGRTLALENVQGGSVTLGIDTQASGQSVNITYQNATAGYGTLYDATIDSSKIFTTDVAQFNVETVTSSNYVGFISQPLRVDAITAPGQYVVYDSSDVPVLVTTALWNQYGGSVNVSINTDNPTSLDIAIQGPGALIPGTLAPYKFGISYGGAVTTSAFSITGSAVFTNPIKLNLLTGANRSKNTALSAADVDNFAINTIAQAYDRGIWASADAGGPVPTLRSTIPTTAISGFGLTDGSLISFKESIYRITGVTIGNAWTQINAKRHITTADFNVIATGRTTAQFVSRWGANQTGDFTIKPLRTF